MVVGSFQETRTEAAIMCGSGNDVTQYDRMQKPGCMFTAGRLIRVASCARDGVKYDVDLSGGRGRVFH